MVLLTVAVEGEVLLEARSVDVVSWVVADAVLLAGVGSGSLPPMVAVLVMVPAVAGAVALIVIVALAPEASEPTAQVTVPEALVQEVGREQVLTPVTGVSGMMTSVWAIGPLLVALRV